MNLISKCALAALAVSSAALVAQNSGLQRRLVETADVSVPGREAVIAYVTLAPAAAAGRHTHPGDEITYVIEGEGELTVEGKPARTVKAGDGFVVVSGAKHDIRNTGSQPMKLTAMYVVEKGKPLATPAP